MRLRASWALGLQKDHFSHLPFAFSPSCLCSSLDCSKLLWARGYGRGVEEPGRHPNHRAAQKPPCQRPQPLRFQHSGRSLGCHQELGHPGPPGTGVSEGGGGGGVPPHSVLLLNGQTTRLGILPGRLLAMLSPAAAARLLSSSNDIKTL